MAGHDEIRVASRADLDRMLAWAADEGWNPGFDDGRAFHAADPLGFFMAWRDGERVAAISVVAYEAAFGFLGLYIVRPEFRGRGLGIALWREALARRHAKLIGLDGVVAQQANYARSGFRLAYRNIRCAGTGPTTATSARTTPALVAATELPFDRIAAYDRMHFPAARPAFLSLWLSPSNGAALAAVDGGRVSGLGVIRACREGFKIGPLFADEERIADQLFCGLCARAAGATVFLDVPEPNVKALRLAERHSLAPVFETARMYTG
ncbi:MAG: GNAT family N-acetyltransferase, partial [Alphaproteobacteria bacterium]